MIKICEKKIDLTKMKKPFPVSILSSSKLLEIHNFYENSNTLMKKIHIIASYLILIYAVYTHLRIKTNTRSFKKSFEWGIFSFFFLFAIK